MYQVSVYLRHQLVEVARRRYGDISSALHGRVALMEEFKRQGIKVRVTAIRRIDG